MMSQAAFILVAAGVALLLIRLLRQGRLREKYAALWLVLGGAILLLALWPDLLGLAADLVGIQVGSNLLFFLAILLLFGVCLHLSLEVSQLEDETRALAEEVAILRLDVAEMAQSGLSDRGEDQVPD